jgi:hypothetical protein
MEPLEDRTEAIQRLKEGVDRMTFCSREPPACPLPNRARKEAVTYLASIGGCLSNPAFKRSPAIWRS